MSFDENSFSGSNAPGEGFNIAEVMLPDHLLLRVGPSSNSRGRQQLANWSAYKFGVEMLLRAKGLERHIKEGGGRCSGMDARRWQAEDDMCKVIIGFNVKDFMQIFGPELIPLSSPEVTAAGIWSELEGQGKSELECKHM